MGVKACYCLFVKVIGRRAWLLLLTLAAFVSVQADTSNDLELLASERQWLLEHPEVTVAFDGDFPPYSFLNDEGELEGFAVDVFKLLSKKAGFTVRVHPEHVWKKLYETATNSIAQDLPSKKTIQKYLVATTSTPPASAPTKLLTPSQGEEPAIDVIATMVNRAQRDEWFKFTSPYVHKSLVVINREDDGSIKQRGDIAGKVIAVVKDYQYINQITAEFPTVKILALDSMLDALNAVSVGDADAAITFLGAGHYYRSKYLLSNLKYAAVYDKESANESIAIRKTAPILADILQKALSSISEDKLQALRGKWLPVDYMEDLVEIDLSKEERLWIKNHPLIRLGVDKEFAPFEYIEEGKYLGMASDYIKLLSQRLNLNMEISSSSNWDRTVELIKKREIDVLPAVGITAERQLSLNYTTPYLQFHRVIVMRTDAGFVSGLDDVAHLPVAVQVNTSHHGLLSKKDGIKLALYQTQREALMAVSSGQVDSFVGNVASASYWIRSLNLSNLKIASPVSTETQSLHFGVRNDWPELRSIIQKGLDSISPRRKKLISEKWLTVQYDPVVDYSLFWSIIAALTLLIVGFFSWNLMLKRQVRLRTSELNYSANYDQLSGLPNRFLIMDRLQQFLNEAHRRDFKVALLSIDIDDFKKINDGYSQKAGDGLIRAVSQRLQNTLRESDSIGHLGADRFLVIQTQINEISDAALLSEKLLLNLKQTFHVEDTELLISASLGISVFPNDGDSVEELLKNASAASHYSKSRFHGGYTFYTKNIIQNISRRLNLDRLMRGALEREEFVVYYQPKVETKTRKIISFEALLRWFSPELGLVSPAEFIPIAEKNNLIEPLGVFVIEQALAQLAEWQQRYSSQLSMAVNLSPVQFRSHQLIGKIESALLTNSLEGKFVEFEVTEGVLLAEYSNVEESLQHLESLGVSLAMDDFGTGYSSMSYLRKYNFDLLKIDGEFISNIVDDISDQKLVSATIAMAHGLGMKVVAERIETEAQYNWLANENCDYLQGWLFSKAAAVEDINKLLEKHFIKEKITELS